MAAPIDVILPSSAAEAVAAFAAGGAITVVGGGTIVTPAIRAGTLAPERVMLLVGAGLDTIEPDAGRLRIGAAVTLQALAATPAPLATAAANVADPEIRGQATVAGNICAGPSDGAPRGDLQGALIALDAIVRWTDGASEHRDRVETFLALPAQPRLLLEVDVAIPERGAFAALRRPHSHGYTPLAVSGAIVDGEVRLAVTGVHAHGVSLRSATDPTPVILGATNGTSAGDALASEWYRREMVPVLTRRVLTELGVRA